MSEPLLTKRLHISGLTPAITSADLERRLSSFGKVKSMDGFGAHDALGDPRKFGYATMEIGTKGLAKCLNLLSGSTWKGAKLRIGEAKPDFRERLAQTNSHPLRSLRPKRMCMRNHGHPSSTLPLVSLSAAAAASTPGWIRTPSGRIVRPMRMRPERPLEPMRGDPSNSKTKDNAKKKRSKQLLVRARRRLIDPTKWDSVYLTGVFLDSVSISLPESVSPGNGDNADKEDVEEEDSSHEDRMSGMETAHEQEVDTGDVHPMVAVQTSAETAKLAPPANLKALFAPKEDASFSLLDHLELDFELDADILGINSISSGQLQGNDHVFESILPSTQSLQVPPAISTTKPRSRVTLDSSLPLVFPPIDSLPHPHGHPVTSTTAMHPHPTTPCFLFPSAIPIRGLHHLPPSTTFARSPQDTSERIRETWENDRSTLTREWKKAWREARGNKRGKIGARNEDGY